MGAGIPVTEFYRAAVYLGTVHLKDESIAGLMLT